MRSITRRSKPTAAEPGSGTIDSLVDALARLLAQGESFTALSVEQLAREAGIARATFYLHFRNKGELISHLMKRVEREVRTAASLTMADNDNFGRGEFLLFMRRGVDILFRHRAALRAMVEASSYDPDVARAYQAFMAKMVDDTRKVIARLQATGRSHPAVTPEVADVLTWTVERSCAQMLKDDDSEASRQKLAEVFTHVVWSSIAAPTDLPVLV